MLHVLRDHNVFSVTAQETKTAATNSTQAHEFPETTDMKERLVVSDAAPKPPQGPALRMHKEQIQSSSRCSISVALCTFSTQA